MDIPKIELHIHLDGAFRPETVFELGKAKGVSTLAQFATVEELRAYLHIDKPNDLAYFLARFSTFMPAFLGDAEAMERAAYELAEDKAKEGVIYFEARYSPHLLSNTLTSNPLYAPEGPYKAKGDVSPSDVVAAISKGLARGQKDFGVKARQILCTLRGCQEYSESILQLAVDHASNGVVGIDMAGSVSSAAESIDPADQLLFKKAAELGIHRTVHAGESGSAGDVLAAIEVLGAERIGHGYHAVDDPAVWKLVLEKQIHLEACPISSLKTGSVADWASHPLKKYVTDKASFSISTDDPLIFGNDTNLELEMLQKHLGFEHLQLWICQVSAAKAAFLPEAERAELVEQIVDKNPILQL